MTNKECEIHYDLEHVKYPFHKKPEYYIPDRDDCVNIGRKECCDKFGVFVGVLGETFQLKTQGRSEPIISLVTFAWRDGEYGAVFDDNDTISFCPFCGAKIVYVKRNERERIQT